MMKKQAIKLMREYMDIAQPDRMQTKPHARTVRTPLYWQERRDLKPYPDTTRTAYYWMAMGIAQLLDNLEK